MPQLYPVKLLLAVALLAGSTASLGQEPPSGASETEAVIAVGAPDYPRTIESQAGLVVLHMPQIDTWENYQTVTAWAALEVTPADTDQTWLGSLKFTASTDIDFEERLVVVHDITVVDQKVLGGETPPESVKLLAAKAISLKPRSIPLDVVLRALPEDFAPPNFRPGPETQIKSDPPPIFVSTTPASLMIIDGEPVKAAIEESSIEFVVNTNWDLFWDRKKERWYVLNGRVWQRSDSLTKPKWKTTTRLPKDLKNLPDDENWAEVRKALPAKKAKDDPASILVSFEPAELILIDGEPRTEAIAQIGLSFVENTESDLLVYRGGYFYLVGGRWFHSESLDGAWSAVDTLPENFAHIPPEHKKGHVLASVPGSADARAAAIEAQIPRIATIKVGEVPEIEVSFDGEPEFVTIEGTPMERAVNTSYQIIKVGGRYYLCYNAVWFVAGEAQGPWVVATEVPEAIYTIPASDPAHNTTYVYVYPQTTTTTTTTVTSSVTYAYTPGYYGAYLVTGAVVFGTGFYYPPYYYYNPFGYPAYWYYPRSYGYGAWYNPATGTYGRRAVAYGPYGGAAATSAYNPRTGTYARGWSAWDGDEMARSGGAYNPRTGTFGGGNMYYDFDDNEGWSERMVQRGDRWVYSETEYDGNRARSEYETARGVTGESNRVRSDDAITGSGTIEAGNRSGTTSSRIDSQGAQASIDGSRGGSVDVSKDWGEAGRDVEITNPEGQGLSGTTTRDGQGNARTEFETSGGGQGTSVRTEQGRTTVGQSESGDLYASRNGEVYKRGDSGDWSGYQNGNWQQLDRSQGGSNHSSLNMGDNSSLNRQHSARQTGTRNYDQYRSQRSSISRGGMRGRRGGGRRR